MTSLSGQEIGDHSDTFVERQPSLAVNERSWVWTIYTWVWVLSCLLVGATVAVIVGGVARLLGDKQARVAHECIGTAYRIIINFHWKYRYSLTGMENLPKGAYILCPNHQSLSDVVYLFALPLQYKFVIKRELFKVPFFGAAMRVARYPAIDRGDPNSARNLLAACSAHLQHNMPILSFPEGTRSKNGLLGRFQSGPARLALHNGVPLVPVGIAGTADLLPRGQAMYAARAHLAIHIGKPISTTGLSPKDARALTRTLRQGVLLAKDAAEQASLKLQSAQNGKSKPQLPQAH